MAPRLSQLERAESSMTKALDAALELFSSQGFGATSMRQIAKHAGLSVGNVYHHFEKKDDLFQELIDRYWQRLLDPDLRLNQVIARGEFPENLEELAAAVEEVVEDNAPHILLIYVDVIEFRGQHIGAFYETMADRFQAASRERLAARRASGELGDVDPMVGVMVAVRWFFYFFTVEKCFGVPMHFGMSTRQAVDEFIRLLRYGVLPRAPGSESAPGLESAES